MTQNQIAYQNLKEGIRHNLATESISSTSNAINREHYIRADQAALSQATSAAKNAETNAYNASINYMNALSNQRQADASLRNAEVNKQNAITNSRNADINLMNAVTQAKNAQTQARRVDIDASIAPSTIASNLSKAHQAEASAFQSRVESYGKYPVVANLVATGATEDIAKAGSAVVGGIKNFFTGNGDPSPVTIGIGFVNRVTPKPSLRGGGGARHSSQGRSTRIGKSVVYD